MYSRQEVEESTLQYFNNDKLATDVWINKYCLKDNQGNFYELNPRDMHWRLAKEFSRIELNYPNPMLEQEIFDLFDNFKYIVPQGSPMFGIGNNFSQTSLSNCFVIGNNGSDSYGSIMRSDEEQVQIMKRRGGCGQDISHLRPSGALANNSILKGISGSTLYMERFSNSTREVSQGDRRGALMLSIDIKHPDVEKFIDMKTEKGKVTGANVSVKISDEFMRDVKNDRVFWQTFPIDLKIPLGEENDNIVCNLELNKLTPIAGGYIKAIKARKLWNKIMLNAWKSAEPGVLFWDTVTKESPADSYLNDWKSVTCNPCGEIPLCPYDSCRLIAINLYSYVDNPFTKRAKFNWEKFKNHATKAQRLMDDLVDLEIEKINTIIDKINNDPEPEEIKSVELNLWKKIKQKAIDGRRTGLGITAEGDMLAALGITYGTKEAIEFSEEVHKVIAVESYKSSIEMAKERGAFPIWDLEKEEANRFVFRIYDKLEEYNKVDYCLTGRRNIANLTIAPTGSLSLLTQTTSGIEPVFKIYYTRRKKTNDKNKADFIDEVGDMWEEYKVFHHKFIKWFTINCEIYIDREHLQEFGWDKVSSENYLKQLPDNELNKLISQSPYNKATSGDVDYIGKVELQGKVQKWVDHSISVTVNMPENVSKETVSEVYMRAYEVGCKGVTVYREGSRSGVLVSNKKEEIKNPSERPKEVNCDINHLTIQGIKWIVIVGIINDKPYEVFALKNICLDKKYKTGKLIKVKSKTYDLKVDNDGIICNITNEFDNPLEGSLTRQISLNLKHVPLEEVYIQLQKEGNVTDFNKAISRVLKKYLTDKELKNKCPECFNNLTMESGCVICKNCGWGKC